MSYSSFVFLELWLPFPWEFAGDPPLAVSEGLIRRSLRTRSSALASKLGNPALPRGWKSPKWQLEALALLTAHSSRSLSSLFRVFQLTPEVVISRFWECQFSNALLAVLHALRIPSWSCRCFPRFLPSVSPALRISPSRTRFPCSASIFLSPSPFVPTPLPVFPC